MRRDAPSKRSAEPGIGAELALGPRLGLDFLRRPTRVVAAELIGCTLIHDGVGGTIVETEAYEEDDPACHGYGGISPRNAALFGPPGRAYVYICYGIHRMFNVVTEPEGTPGAVLIRALRPTHEVEAMRRRRPRAREERQLCSGPGKICEALAISEDQTHESLIDGPIALHAPLDRSRLPEVVVGPRIGLTKATELPWRYCALGSPYLSRPSPGSPG